MPSSWKTQTAWLLKMSLSRREHSLGTGARQQIEKKEKKEKNKKKKRKKNRHTSQKLKKGGEVEGCSAQSRVSSAQTSRGAAETARQQRSRAGTRPLSRAPVRCIGEQVLVCAPRLREGRVRASRARGRQKKEGERERERERETERETERERASNAVFKSCGQIGICFLFFCCSALHHHHHYHHHHQHQHKQTVAGAVCCSAMLFSLSLSLSPVSPLCRCCGGYAEGYMWSSL